MPSYSSVISLSTLYFTAPSRRLTVICAIAKIYREWNRSIDLAHMRRLAIAEQYGAVQLGGNRRVASHWARPVYDNIPMRIIKRDEHGEMDITDGPGVSVCGH
jgi:hypothetical protein